MDPIAPDTVLPSVSLSEPGRAFLAGEKVPMSRAAEAPDARTIVVDPDDRDQPLLGLGSVITGTDLAALRRLPPDAFDAALRALFDPTEGAGWSCMRVPLGSTDWEPTPDFFTYDDAPEGVRDWDLAHFSVARDRERGLFALLRRAREINPALRFHGAVWGIPPWMKENRLRCYGRFDPACAEAYARYLARAVLALREEGVPLVAVSPQNESLTANDRPTPAACMPWWVQNESLTACDRPTPATCMPWWEQRDVLVAMRRAFDRAGLGDVAAWAFDHNYDLSDFFVRPLLADPAARAAIGGVAFHDYGGEPEPAMGALHREMPDLPLYATRETWKAMEGKLGKIPPGVRHEFFVGQEFCLGELGVSPFSIPHDAADPVGYRLWGGPVSIATATDLGHFSRDVFDRIRGSDLVLLESNHDPDLLRANPHYSQALKSRILGSKGHLSNEACSEALLHLIAAGTRNVILGHLSGENNNPALARRVSVSALEREGIRLDADVRLKVALRDEVGEVFTLSHL